MIAFLLTQFGAVSLGIVLYHLLRLGDAPRVTRWAFVFAIGHGGLALLNLAFGVAGIPVGLALVMAMVAGTIHSYRYPGRWIPLSECRGAVPGRDPVAWAALLLLIGFGAVALLQALAPPAAKDEVNYQLAVAKWYQLEHAIVFVPNNWSFHFPQLVNMSFLQGLVWGGEISAKLQVFMLWVVALLAAGSLAPKGARLLAACTFAAIPIVAAHSGLCFVDIGTALFGMLALAATLRCRAADTDRSRWVIAAGVMAGFAAGTKLTGIFVPIALTPLLLFGGGWRKLPAFLIAAFLAGFPFYLVHWIQAGNPVYPFFPEIFGGRDLDPALISLVMENRSAGEGGIGATLLRILRLPLDLSFSAKQGVEFLGPAFLAYLPLSLWSGADRRHLRRAVLFAGLFLLMWLFISPMIRLALPAWGALCGLVAAAAASPRWTRFRTLAAIPLLIWCLVSLAIMARWLQVNGTLDYHFGGTSRADYLAARLPETFGGGPDYRDLVKANEMLRTLGVDRVLTNVHYRYYIDARHEDIRQIISRAAPDADAGDDAWGEFADGVVLCARADHMECLLVDRTMAPDDPLCHLMNALERKRRIVPLLRTDTIALFALR